MKKYLPLIIAFLNYGTLFAQVNDTAIQQLMQQRMYDCYEVEYNSILVAPRLYNAGRVDTFDALVTFWKKHCPPSERLFSIDVLNNIRKNTFRESVNGSEFLSHRARPTVSDSDLYRPKILYYLEEYKAACRGAFSDNQYSIWLNQNYPLPRDYSEYYAFYKSYYAFLRQMARSLQGRRLYTPAEDFLLWFYAAPDSIRYSELDSAIYTGTVLNDKYKAYQKYHNQAHGISSAIQVGMWVPNGNLTVVGNHPFLAYSIGGRTEGMIIDLITGFRFGGMPNSLQVVKGDSLFTSDSYCSWYIGVDFAAKIFRTRKSELNVLWGVGYDELQTLSVTLESSSPTGQNETLTQSSKSAYANAGLAYRFYIRDVVKKNMHKRAYVALQAKYHYVNFRNPGGTDLAGNAITVGLSYGIFSHSYTKHPYLK